MVFLAATRESRLVTGASVFIDGGQTILGGMTPAQALRAWQRAPAR